MAVTVSAVATNERGQAYKVVGDGSTTNLGAVAYNGWLRPGTTAKATVNQTPTKWSYEGKTGLFIGKGGTDVSATVAIDVAAKTLTVTTSPAITNGATASVEIAFTQGSF